MALSHRAMVDCQASTTNDQANQRQTKLKTLPPRVVHPMYSAIDVRAAALICHSLYLASVGSQITLTLPGFFALLYSQHSLSSLLHGDNSGQMRRNAKTAMPMKKFQMYFERDVNVCFSEIGDLDSL